MEHEKPEKEGADADGDAKKGFFPARHSIPQKNLPAIVNEMVQRVQHQKGADVLGHHGNRVENRRCVVQCRQKHAVEMEHVLEIDCEGGQNEADSHGEKKYEEQGNRQQ